MARKSTSASGGYVKLYRKLLQSPEWRCGTPAQHSVMVAILLLVNHEPAEWLWKGKLYKLKAGQMITSFPALAEAAGCSLQQTRTAVFNLCKLGWITRESTHESTLITVEKWGSYQGVEKTSNTPPNARITHKQYDEQPTANAPITTNKNNIRIIKNNIRHTTQLGRVSDEKKSQSVLELLTDAEYKLVSAKLGSDALLNIVDEIDAEYDMAEIEKPKALILGAARKKGFL